MTGSCNGTRFQSSGCTHFSNVLIAHLACQLKPSDGPKTRGVSQAQTKNRAGKQRDKSDEKMFIVEPARFNDNNEVRLCHVHQRVSCVYNQLSTIIIDLE